MNGNIVYRVARVLAMLVVATTAASATAAGYVTQAGKIYDATGQEVELRGISHFGFNATILQPQFLWAMGWKEQIAQIKSLGFNAIRVPFVPDTLYNTTPVNQLSYVDPGRNPELLGKTPLQVLDLWMAEANRQGLYLLLDFHSVSKQRQYPTWFVSNPADFGLVYNNQAYTKENWTRDLAFVAARYAHLPYFLGIDIYNEPNGSVRWSTGDPTMVNPSYFWKSAAEAAATAVLSANPNLLVFVQGIAGNFDGREVSTIPINWGEDLQPQAYQPLHIPVGKLVLSPHTYGPDVYRKPTFSAASFPANLAADWDVLFGQFRGQHPVVVGEWGGKFGQGTGGQADAVWQNAFVDYLRSKGMRSNFYWCYTPNSGDTGGILDDGLQVRADKMALLQRLWAAPTAQPPPNPVPPPPPPPPPAPPPATDVQQNIMNFSPGSGPVGTVVTLNGSGFAGSRLAWVGAAHNGAVTVVSDAQLRVTIPAGATTGAIGIFNATHAAFTATPFTVTSAAPVYPQPSITNFSPGSGPVGTVVTLNGSGFTGSTSASVGAAQNAAVTVVSDTQVRVTIPTGATSGVIGVFNPTRSAFTATSFTVTGAATANPQQNISNFSPSSGAVGTVVTINGSGFTGSTLAWVGAAHNGAVTVVSDTQLRVTIPVGATTGAIGIFNPAHAAFTATSFTVR
jgi:aryl-phospho-beta-D-glucosidase BglC (GH1 family)